MHHIDNVRIPDMQDACCLF